MFEAKEAYRLAKKVVREAEDWAYLEERINYHVNRGHVQFFVSFNHNPQTAIHMLRELGYTVAVEKVDPAACYYGFIISWFPLNNE